MSTKNALASIQAEIQKELASVNKTVAAPTGVNISTKGKQFTTPDGATSSGPMNAIILDYRNVNEFYEGVYNPQEVKPPVCMAVSKTIDDMEPLEGVEKPQHTDCASCPHNQFGSAPVGKGKACKNTVRLAITPAGADENSPVWVLKVSPSAIKAWSGYMRKLAAAGLHPMQVVTQISFDPNQAYPSLQFEAKGEHDNLGAIAALRAQAASVLEPRVPTAA